MKKISYSITNNILGLSCKEKEPYLVSILGKDFIVLPGVFSPKYFEDTEIFAKNLPISGDKKLLEIGCGVGAISIMAVYRGVGKVVAVDINSDAVKNTQKNIKLHRMEGKVEVRLGDVFDSIKPNEKFDLIFWNAPFCYIEDGNISDLERSVYDVGYKSIEKYIKNSTKYVTENGQIFLGFSSSLGRKDLIEMYANEAGLDLKLVFQCESKSIKNIRYEIFSLG